MAICIEIPPPAVSYYVRTVSSSSNNTIKDGFSNNILLDQDLMDQIYLKEKFNSLKEAWEKKTMLSSSISKITEDANFKRIVQMGSKIIPLVIDEIEKKPSTLVWALNLITGRTLASNSRLTVTDACKIWVKLYKAGEIG